MVGDHIPDQPAVTRQLRVWRPVVALAAGVLLLVVRSEVPVRAIQDALQAFAYGAFTLGAVDLAERVLTGLGWPRWSVGGTLDGASAEIVPQARDGAHPLSAVDKR